MRVDKINLEAFSIPGHILVVRDDLFPSFMGGNKARKMEHILPDIIENRCNAVVTTGGIQSNHCRVVALACARHHWECRLVLHGSRDQFYDQLGNALIIRAAGAKLEFVDAADIGPSMDRAMEELRTAGFRPYYLYGGGHNRAGVRAYAQAVHELKASLPADYSADHIFLASGTGSTQAGILAGCREVGWQHTRVHGISVARGKERGLQGIRESLGFLQADAAIMDDLLEFSDDYLFGGYGRSTEELESFMDRVNELTGVILDSTYSGKGFYGMVESIRKQQLRGNILFWHTGGIFNLMV